MLRTDGSRVGSGVGQAIRLPTGLRAPGSGGLAEQPGSTALALLCAEDVFAERSVIEHYVSRTCLRALLNELAAARANGSWNHDILGVLHRMCSCGGVAVVQNQLLIAEYLLGSQSTAGSAVLAAKSRRRKVSSLKAGTNQLEQLENMSQDDENKVITLITL